MDDRDDIFEMLKALGDEARWAIFCAVARLGSVTRTVIAVETGYINTCWHHLGILVNAGLLIKDEVDRHEILFYVNKEALQSLIGVLGEIVVM